VEDDDEDEDYSMNEDMLKNQKRYKFDEDWQAKNRISVPKSEIDKLIADQRKEVQETVPTANNSMVKNPLKTNIIN
jgi:parvulin-like peptidyl-prolyl isomerase